MEFEIKTAKLVGRSSEKLWGQAFSYKNLVVVVELKGGEGINAILKGKELLEELSGEYEEAELPTLNHFKKIIERKIDEGLSLNCLTGLLKGPIFYLCLFGDGLAVIKRRETLAVILDSPGSASGVLKEGDIIFLSSPKFNQIISPKELKESLEVMDVEEVAEKLAPFLHEDKQSLGAAALIFKTHPKKSLEEERQEEKKKKKKKLFVPEKANILTKFLKNLREGYKEHRFRIKRGRGEKISRKTLNTVAIFLILLLSASIFLGIRKKEKTLKETKFEKIYNLAKHKSEEGEALLDLNPIRARTLLFEAKTSLEEIKNDFKKESLEGKKIDQLYEKIKASLGLAARVYKLENLPLFFDLSLLKEKGEGEKLSLYKEKMAVLDKKNSAIYSILLKTKAAEIVAGGEKLKDLIDVSLHGNRVFILTPEEVLMVNIQSKTLNLAVKREEKWGEISDLASFAGNLYLLDTKNNQIWKYISTESGFSKIRNYLNPDVSVQFTQAKSIAIDGSIWVLAGRQILKFTQGRPDPFKIKGLEEELYFPEDLFTDDESKNLYVLEKEKGRIVVFDKEGVYQAQYFHEGIKEVSEMVVSEKQKKIFLLSKNKIYGIEIE